MYRYRQQRAWSKMGVGNEEGIKALLTALHDPDQSVQIQAAESLGQVGIGNEEGIKALLAALHHKNWSVQVNAVVSLGRLEIKDFTQLRQVLVALNRCFHGWDNPVRENALVSIRQLLDGRPIPGNQWVPLWKRRARNLLLKRLAFWLGMTAIVGLLCLLVTWQFGVLNPDSFLVRFLAVLTGLLAFVSALFQVLGRTLRDPWDHS